jgi:hypothetical protein
MRMHAIMKSVQLKMMALVISQRVQLAEMKTLATTMTLKALFTIQCCVYSPPSHVIIVLVNQMDQEQLLMET